MVQKAFGDETAKPLKIEVAKLLSGGPQSKLCGPALSRSQRTSFRYRHVWPVGHLSRPFEIGVELFPDLRSLLAPSGSAAVVPAVEPAHMEDL
jgi:hypothetical protein